LEILCQEAGRALRWNTALAQEWIAGQRESELIFYVDGHVRVYHGDLTPLPRHYVARERLCLRATTDYWINAMDGQPFVFVNQAVDPGLLATLRSDLVPWLETNVPVSDELQQRLREDPHQHWFTLVFDREAYSPEFFADMRPRHIAILTYHKYPGEDWPVEEFGACSVRLASGEEVTMKLAERGTMLSNHLWVREVRKLSEGGHQTSILSTNYQADYTLLAVSMFARWSQENFYKYMRQHYGLDRLAEYGTEPVPAPIQTVNPAWRRLDAQVRAQGEKRRRQLALFGRERGGWLPTKEEPTTGGHRGPRSSDPATQSAAQADAASHCRQGSAGIGPLQPLAHRAQALHRHHQTHRLPGRNQYGLATPR
jgi:hypothetical protein